MWLRNTYKKIRINLISFLLGPASAFSDNILDSQIESLHNASGANAFPQGSDILSPVQPGDHWEQSVWNYVVVFEVVVNL